MTTDLQALRGQLVETARAIVRSGAISMSGHGNISIRVPGRDEIIYTAASTLANFDESGIARLHLDGTVLEGEVSPMAAAVISMHVAIYTLQAISQQAHVRRLLLELGDLGLADFLNLG